MLIELLKKAKPYMPLLLVRLLEYLYYRLYMKALCLYLNRTESCAEAGIPKASLRYRVNGTPHRENFLSEGENCSKDLVRALVKTGRKLDSFHHVLDFGCGCGRTLRWFAGQTTASRFYGTDIDAEAISFCRGSMKQISFSINGPLPPLEYPAAQFDLIYCISVFTHLNEEYQLRWLAELQRVAKPGGILLLSVHGEHCWHNLPVQQVSRLREQGFLFLAQDVWKGIFPNWYQTAFHTEDYVGRVFSRYFSVVEYVPRGISDYQDLVIVRNDLVPAASTPDRDLGASIRGQNG